MKKLGALGLTASLLFASLFTVSANAADQKYEVDRSEVTIGHKLEERSTSELFKGEKRVIQEGKDGKGLKSVIRGGASPEISITVLESPRSTIVEVGTKTPTLDNLPKTWRPGGSGLTDASQKLRAILFHKFPTLESIGGYRECDTAGEHCTGRALDIMVSGELGFEIMEYLEGLHNNKVINLCWNIYEQQIYMADSDFTPSLMDDRGSITQNHFDHVHAFLADDNGVCSRGA